jgi:hypothetical protein
MGERVCERWMATEQLVYSQEGVTGRVYGYVTDPWYEGFDEVFIRSTKPGAPRAFRSKVYRCRPLGLAPGARDEENTDG